MVGQSAPPRHQKICQKTGNRGKNQDTELGKEQEKTKIRKDTLPLLTDWAGYTTVVLVCIGLQESGPYGSKWGHSRTNPLTKSLF